MTCVSWNNSNHSAALVMPAINPTRPGQTPSQLLATGVAILLLGFFTRLHNLGGDSFWIDEILTVETARNGPSSFLDVRDHPPLTYALTSLAIGVWGETEFSARIPALVAGMLGLPLTILMGKSLGHQVAGLWAALLLVLSPIHIAYSQEARHYVLLLAISLASYIVLYRAIKKPRWPLWIAYAFLASLNLYNHYGAFFVLISQTIFIVGWLTWRTFQVGLSRSRQNWRYPIASGFLVLLAYLPWLPRLRAVARSNLGSRAMTGTGGIASLADWLEVLFYHFGMYRSWLPYLVLLLGLIGIATLVWKRQWLILALIAAAVMLPLLLIQLFQVSRGVYGRYVLHILPFYLLAAALGLTALVDSLVWPRFGRRGYFGASVLLAGLLLLVARPGISAEHERVQEDWRGILRYVDETAADGDALVGVSMNYRNQFNLVAASLPYYLNDAEGDYLWLPAGRFSLDQALDLASRQGSVSVIAFDWDEPAALLNSDLEVDQFQTALYVGRQSLESGSSLDKTIALFRELIAVVRDPLQACMFAEDMAVLLLADGQPEPALSELDRIEADCPTLTVRSRFVSTHIEALAKQLDVLLATGRHSEAERLAVQLLEYRPEHIKALEVLTVFDLLHLFSAGQARVDEQYSPEPVQATSFTMPGEGEGREVILIHPPSSVTYRLTLPEGKPLLRTRLALAPESWPWGGDGATFIVRIQPVDGSPQELERIHIGNSQPEHVWHVVELPLDDYSGQEVILSLATEAGPAGDATGDWAGWETPRILRRAP